MSISTQPGRLSVPDGLRRQLAAFRTRVWTTKLSEAVTIAVAVSLIALLVVFTADRLWDTPQPVRLGIFIATIACWLIVPWAFHRWVWKHRRLDQLARLLRVREPNVGDQLLGVIELAESDTEQARSPALCAAAMEQVAASAEKRDLNEAAPESRLRLWSSVVALSLFVIATLSLVATPAVTNAFARLSMPWKNTPRYTFTEIQSLASEMVVPHGEPVAMNVRLHDASRWNPDSASIRIDGLPADRVAREGVGYRFTIPARTETTKLHIRVGDYYQDISVEPKLRPELVAADAKVHLPDYLQLSDAVDHDVRGGTLNVVEGSRATIRATASRDLQSATVDSQSVDVNAASFASSQVDVVGAAREMKLTWRDRDGLAGREPFELTVNPASDEPPSVATQDLPRQAVLLETEQLNFKALSADDFGVRRIGISWQGIDERLTTELAKGERVLAMGGPDKSSLQVPGTFSAKSFGIEPQPIEVRLWVEDYRPGRERVYSSSHIFFVFTAEQHAIWITDQLNKWHRASLDVRDREMRLHERNKQIRQMTPEQLADDEMRKQLRQQAAAEASNGRRLSGLSQTGQELLRTAARNPEIGVGHLERWAEMMKILDDIASNRMPSVSDLLDQASSETKLARAGKPAGPAAGKIRSSAGGAQSSPDEESPEGKPKPPIPSIVDHESSLQPAEENELGEGEKKPDSKPRLSLPVTTIAGPPQSPGEQPEQDEDPVIDQAIDEQADLLAEFEKIADELNTILANLEGSTLVKRLKAASREQDQIAEKIGSRIDAVFGKQKVASSDDRKLLADLGQVEVNSRQNVSFIMDDMQSYFERRRMNQFKVVLDEMRDAEVLTALQDLSVEIAKQQGMSIAQAEYWSDTMDRWADDLVDPACSGM